MGRGVRNGAVPEEADEKSGEEQVRTPEDEQRDHRGKRRSKNQVEDSESEYSSDSDSGKRRRRRGRSKEESEHSDSGTRRRRGRSREDSESESESESGSGSEEGSESEEERRRRKRREKRKRREREEERERKRRKKEKERKRKKEEEKKRKKDKEKKKKEKMERGKKGAVTDTWGKYGTIREIDMWNKRPEFTAWLAEIKQVNLESLPNWEEKQLFKQYMEDYNTATFPSKKYYNLDAYYGRKMEKEMKKGMKKGMKKVITERTVFDDEEQRRLELLRERERQKEEEVQTLKRSMQSGMAQAMKEQAQLREEMAYQYKLGNFEAAAAIQRRLDPDVAL